MNDGAVLRITQPFEVIYCCTCRMPFAVPADIRAQWRADGDNWFYCPNGHMQHYKERALAADRDRLRGLLRRVLDTGEAEARAKLQLDNARKNYTSHRDYLDTWVAAAQAASDAEKAARAALGTADQPTAVDGPCDKCGGTGYYVAPRAANNGETQP